MGNARKVSDGKAWNATIPGSTVVADGELIRAGAVNGCIVGAVAADDTERTKAMEFAHDFVHSIHIPSGINPADGTFLYWADPSTFQYGPDDLQVTAATGGDAPCFFVLESRTSDPDGGYVVRGRVLNGVLG